MIMLAVEAVSQN